MGFGVRYFDLDPGIARERLRGLGARCHRPRRLIQRVALAAGGGVWAGLHSEGERHVLTLMRDQRTVREVLVSDFDAARDILEGLGLQITGRQELYREAWELHAVEFRFADGPGLAPSLEIHGPSEQAVRWAIGQLGLDPGRAQPIQPGGPALAPARPPNPTEPLVLTPPRPAPPAVAAPDGPHTGPMPPWPVQAPAPAEEAVEPVPQARQLPPMPHDPAPVPQAGPHDVLGGPESAFSGQHDDGAVVPVPQDAPRDDGPPQPTATDTVLDRGHLPAPRKPAPPPPEPEPDPKRLVQFTVAETGWTAEASEWVPGEYWIRWATVLHNPNLLYWCELPAVQITVRDEFGKVIGSEEQVLTALPPRTRIAWAGLLEITGNRPHTLEITPRPADWYPTQARPEDFPAFGYENVSLELSEAGCEVTGTVRNPYAESVEEIALVALFRDARGNLLNGEMSFVQGLPARGTAAFKIEGTVPSPPGPVASLDLLAQPWSEPNPWEDALHR